MRGRGRIPMSSVRTPQSRTEVQAPDRKSDSRRKRKILIAAAAAITGLSVFAWSGREPAQAATSTWNNNGTDWATAARWTGGVPGEKDTAALPSGASGTL